MTKIFSTLIALCLTLSTFAHDETSKEVQLKLKVQGKNGSQIGTITSINRVLGSDSDNNSALVRDFVFIHARTSGNTNITCTIHFIPNGKSGIDFMNQVKANLYNHNASLHCINYRSTNANAVSVYYGIKSFKTSVTLKESFVLN